MSAVRAALVATLALLPLQAALAQAPQTIDARKVETQEALHRGRPALRVADAGGGGDDRLAVLAGPDFKDGEITLWLAGERGPRAAPTDRGFVGVAFRVTADRQTFEGVYLRPENSQADDQLRRNRTLQYHSPPVWTWQRLRSEAPGLYETYADVEPGAWTRLRVVVEGAKARVYVGDAARPSLIVNDLKRGGDATGAVALWVGPGTVAYFADVSVRSLLP